MQLITERLLLREFVAEDWPAVLAYQSDPRYLRLYAWTERSAEDVQAFVQMFLDYQREQPRRKYQLAIELRAEGRLIGNCGIRKPSADAHEAEMGYELAPDYWGRGYATEAARAVLTFGFEQLGLHRVSADCLAENMASAHVLEKLGMQREGRLRENQWIKGRWRDTLLYGMLEPEWRSASLARMK
jgi:RimJ/RimL family protein N-acetyltransferase